MQDPAIQEYFNKIKTSRNNNGHISKGTIWYTRAAVRNFLHYTDLPITDHTLYDLIQTKRNNPNNIEIESAIRAFSVELPIRHHHNQATYLLGIFRANYTPLNLRIYNHFPPANENCTEGTFREIYNHLTPEQQDMIQWALYVPQRATAAYRIPIDEIDLSRQDYAVIWIQAQHPDYNNKARVTHPAFIPIEFAKKVIANARAAGRRTVFPNHQSQWKLVTTFAKNEYHVRLVSNYTRKMFADKADDSRISPALAAFLMGDKTKLEKTGHLPYSTTTN